MLVARQEDHRDAVAAALGERHLGVRGDRAQERVGDLEEDARPVAGVRLRAARAAVLQVRQHGEGVAHDAVRRPALGVHHEAEAAGVVLELRVV